jgi:hypothetical protein
VVKYLWNFYINFLYFFRLQYFSIKEIWCRIFGHDVKELGVNLALLPPEDVFLVRLETSWERAGNEQRKSFLMIFPYTPCLAGNGLIPKLTKIKDFAILLLIEQKYFVVEEKAHSLPKMQMIISLEWNSTFDWAKDE